MVQLLKYTIAFFLGCLFISHNPELNTKVISASNVIKEKIISLTGKAERIHKNEIDLNKAKEKQAEEQKKNKAKENAEYE